MNGESITINDLKPLNHQATILNRIDNTSVLGGNLALTRRSIKTAWEPIFDDKIVVLEETGENIEQTLIFINNINDNGLFRKCKAIIFGQMYDEPIEICDKLSEENVSNEKKYLKELVDHYNKNGYLSLTIDFDGQSFSGRKIKSV